MPALEEWLDTKLKNLNYLNITECKNLLLKYVREYKMKLKTDYAPESWARKLCLVVYNNSMMYAIPYDYPSEFAFNIKTKEAEDLGLSLQGGVENLSLQDTVKNKGTSESPRSHALTQEATKKFKECEALRLKELQKQIEEINDGIEELNEMHKRLETKRGAYDAAMPQLVSNLNKLNGGISSSEALILRASLVEEPHLQDLINVNYSLDEESVWTDRAITNLFSVLDSSLDSGLDVELFLKMIRLYARKQFVARDQIKDSGIAPAIPPKL